MDITYESIYNIYNEFFTEQLNLGQVTNGLKFLAVSFFLLNVYTNMFSKMGGAMGRAQLPFDQNKILSSLFMVLLVASYDKLLNLLDTMLLGFDSAYGEFSPFRFAPPEDGLDDANNPAEWGIQAVAKQAAAELIKVIKDPTHLFVLLLEGIAWIIDGAIYAVFLLERFFFIGVLKVLGGVAIVMAVFEKFRDLFYKWLKLYVAIYLLIIPFFLILGFAEFAFDYFDSSIGYNSTENMLLGSKVRCGLLAIIIWLKLRLFKKSYDLVYKIFT